ncbi:ATP phosphoribosyltransferase regulatory subunit [Rhodobacteraceae bacterium NNCM2]|nr:ATP phosphoribosyltransferase regulatory subunit [Coraliihabitans acroporae]
MTEADVLNGAALAEIESMLSTLSTIFTDAGYAPVQPAHLFPAEALLDLYGEDIRARAFLFPDPAHGGELCLRPDFTVPVAMAHGAAGWDRAGKYCYQGPVFRQQEVGVDRPTEYVQAGIEDLGDDDTAAAEVRVFAIIHRGLDALSAPPHRTTIGDLGIVRGLLDALEMPEGRRRQLRRHIWRPSRFHQLLESFGQPQPEPSPRRAALLEAVAENRLDALLAGAGEIVGLRSPASIRDRARALAATRNEPPMPREQIELIEAVLSLRCPAAKAPERLVETIGKGADIAAAIERFSHRLDVLARAGFDLDAIHYDAAFGRNLEYYDGFVFEVVAERGANLPPLAGGGRYDTITKRLGAASSHPAVGGIIRPETLARAR